MMLNIYNVIDTAITPALDELPSRMSSREAVVMLVAIGLQESRLIHRKQIGGPARGLWQFEQGGGVRGVLTHAASMAAAVSLCITHGVQPATRSVYVALEHDDILAAGFARLLLWTDPRALPAPTGDNAGEAWQYYLRNWRPGKPHPQTWPEMWQAAIEAVCPER